MSFKMNSLFQIFLCTIALTFAHVSLAQNSHQDFVNAHNVFRSQVGIPPLAWNKTIAAYAQKYANKRRGDCNMVHSMGPYGENLAEGYRYMAGADAVKFWAAEKPHYDHKSNSCVGAECLHYTEVVWRKSVHVGCARIKCHNNWVFVICNYDPPGNIVGQRPY
ncbi:basic form of pathogenesis-related protein 1-like [Rutidosis leptorrhynchoides]|uniref:basic form of pathogenesis-related protein 1-like n=1 Tax=Rutidosis leptorrhynchoides TaxID=125765 RepID=UPI003A98FD55